MDDLRHAAFFFCSGGRAGRRGIAGRDARRYSISTIANCGPLHFSEC